MIERPPLPYGRQWVDATDVQLVLEALQGDFLTTGPQVERFEASLCAYTGTTNAAVLNSGTSALHAAYAAIGLGPGDRLITSPLTFAATGNAALYLGAEVDFADIDEGTGNLDPESAEAMVKPETRLIVPVDYAGHPADYDAFRRISDKHGLALVADAAHSLGATYKGRKVGTLADLTELSFHPVKPITTAEGGAVLGGAPDLIDQVKSFRSHGIIRDPERMERNEGPWYHEMQMLGFNYRLTDLQCALGLSQMRRLDAFLGRRRDIAARYNHELSGCPGLGLPHVHSDVTPGWHLYVVRVQGDPGRRRPFFDYLRSKGLGVQVHYLPVYRHPYYERLGYRAGLCPRAEDFYSRAVSLPLFPKMTDAEVDRVVEAVWSGSQELLA